MNRFNGGKLPEIQNTCSKRQKIKQFLEREALNVEYLWKVPVCLPLTLSPRTLFCHCISSKAFLRTSLRKRFEVIQIFKAQTAGREVGFSFDRGEHIIIPHIDCRTGDQSFVPLTWSEAMAVMCDTCRFASYHKPHISPT